MTLQQLEQERMEARRTAELAIQHLSTDPKKPAALLLFSWTRETLTPVSFPNESIIEKIAFRNGFYLARLIQPMLGNFDHHLFLTRVENLSDDQLLKCISSNTEWNARP